jgi:alkylated DNA nucleotide flippase Atl1
LLEIDGKTFESPSGAGRHVKGGITNGWSFWRLPDGRQLRHVRAVYTREDPAKASASFDWSALHTILEALPVGYWTTYGRLADAVGTAPVPLGQHVASCQQCANAYRVLNSGGTVAENFRWSDPQETRSPEEMLQAEGAVIDGRGVPARELSSDDLQALIDE